MASAVNARVLVLFLAVCRLLPGTRAACYYPSGLLAPNDTPCRDDTPHATCCGQGYACLSNGICQATGEELKKPGASEFVRGSCTDKTWRSSNCPLFCINEEYDYLDGGTGIAKCENTSNDLYVCIDGQESSCEEGINVLYFPGMCVCVSVCVCTVVLCCLVLSCAESE
ncbi:hypothetical protein MYCTH_2310829 [Thermothelomyces thermophilus ATCC 42464]|uniref:Uncharacterized protein n=1 Tax=Thermothelomyces thermophilus (strain ATCC 42464 / BCRC 31852 / DSM 1799) TaxID=573729 RepID=G2QM66_THET4|nr:uncharacterized protein MYCTH_2310829 [Thermothelomyces thermophilus ATCC 42464]AEO61046.1 hypothetical protein MYCTH_2310829 [Thermothelomyces thermophilus ATCC 42464]